MAPLQVSIYGADDFFPCRAQSERFGTRIYSETVTKIDLSRRPFMIWTEDKAVEAETVIIATGSHPTLLV